MRLRCIKVNFYVQEILIRNSEKYDRQEIEGTAPCSVVEPGPGSAYIWLS
jgi:hypothetical protein